MPIPGIAAPGSEGVGFLNGNKPVGEESPHEKLNQRSKEVPNTAPVHGAASGMLLTVTSPKVVKKKCARRLRFPAPAGNGDPAGEWARKGVNHSKSHSARAAVLGRAGAGSVWAA